MKVSKILKLLIKGGQLSKSLKPQNETTVAKTTSDSTISEDMTEEEEDAVIEHTNNELSSVSELSPKDIVGIFKIYADAANDAIKFCSAQETKREKIRSERDLRLAQIDAQRRVIELYLEKTFDERAMVFRKQFMVVDHALITNNSEQLAFALQSIQDLAKSSPFKALADVETVRKELTQESSTFDI